LTLHPLRKLVLGCGVALGSAGVALAANPGTATTTTGQNLNIEIIAPGDGTNVAIEAPLTVDGITALGALPTASASIVYIVDVSGSTAFEIGLDCNDDGSVDAGDDFTANDGGIGSRLDCEIGGIIALNDSLQANTDVNVAVVAFGSDAAVISPFMSPPDADSNNNGIPDVNETLATLDQGGSPSFPVGSLTSFDAAIETTIAAFAARPANEQKIAYFFTDGGDSSGQAEAVQASDAGIRIEGFAVGDGATECAGSTLETIVTTTGGSCTNVTDISQLIAELTDGSNQPPTGIDRVEFSLNGGPAVDLPVDLLGQFTNEIPAGTLASGANTLTATVFAEDGTQATADIVVNASATSVPVTETQICNDLINMQILQNTITVDPTPTSCGAFGTMSFMADLRNISGNPIDDLFLTVTELSNGNLLCNADNGPGTVGDTYTIGDVAVNPGNVQYQFDIGLASRSQFSFFVDAFCELPAPEAAAQ